MVYYEARLSATGLFYVLFLDVVDLHLFLAPALGIVGRQTAGFFESAIGHIGNAFCFYNYVGAGHVLGVEPPVTAICKLEGQFFVLIIVLAHINVETIAADIVERLAGHFYLLGILTGFASVLAAVFAYIVFAADVTAVSKLFFDLYQVFLQKCNVQSGADGLKMVDFRLYFSGQFGQGFVGTF